MATGSPQLWKFEINSIDVTSYVASAKYETSEDAGSIKAFTIILSRAVDSVLDVFALNELPITVQRGVASATEEYIFRGYVTNSVPSGGIIEVVCSDRLYKTTKVIVTTSFDINIDAEAGVISEIFKTLVNDYGGLVADGTSIQDSGTVNTIERFVCRTAVLYERLKTLADTISWQFYYNPVTDKVHFEPKGFLNQSTTLETGTNIVDLPNWNYDTQNLFTKVDLRGAVQEVETIETGQVGVTTGYTTTSVQLTKSPLSVRVFADAANPPTTLRTGGVPGSTSSYQYSVDFQNKKINWNTGTYAPLANHYVKVEITYPVPAPVVVSDDVAHGLYDPDPDVWKTASITRNDITSVADAELYATEWLADRSAPIIRTTIKVTNVSDLACGQSVTVNDLFNGINQTFIVSKVVKQYPHRFDEVSLVSNIVDEDDYEYNIAQRLKRLEELTQTDNDLLLHVLSGSDTITHEPRYLEVQRRTVSTGQVKFILGHPEFGVLGTSVLGDAESIAIYGDPLKGIYGSAKYGDTTGVPFTRVQLIPGNNTFKEFMYDDEFYDSAASTGTTWDTTGKEITTSGYVVVGPIALGVTYSRATLYLSSASDVSDIEISATGKSNWQTIVPNTETTLSPSDATGVYLRFFAFAGADLPADLPADLGGPITIINTYKNTGKYDEPGITLILEE